MTRMLDAALYYAVRGTPIFPVNFADKHPLTEHGFKNATTDVKQIRTWWCERVWPLAMIGIPTGPRSGLWVLDPDCDPDKGIDGLATVARLVANHGPLPSTLTSITPRGGRHLLFRWQDQFPIRSSTSEIGPGVDVRGDGGYFIAPPSARMDGAPYRWEDETIPIVEAPVWLIELALKAKPATNGASRRIIGTIGGNGSPSPQATSSARDIAWARAALERESMGLTSNAALNIAAFNLGQIVGGGALSEDEVRERLYTAAEDRGLILDYGEPSVINTIKSGLKAGMAQPRTRPRS